MGISSSLRSCEQAVRKIMKIAALPSHPCMYPEKSIVLNIHKNLFHFFSRYALRLLSFAVFGSV